jgi:acyl-[acyl-carrier-protein]-phospholipid O-acyltransferase / long-chain-fatty-acid--[acyl-carrier-protein] ligase
MAGFAFDDLVLPRRFLRMCRRNLRRKKIADSSGIELSGAALLTATLALRRLLRREVLSADENHVGILLPPLVATALANAALTLDRRVAVNLNYTANSELVNASMAQCEVRHVLTSRRMLERFPLKLDAELVYVEDLRQRVTWADKLLSAAATWLLPAALLERLMGLAAIRPDDVATIMFTSGSTGQPKGVVLTFANIGTNLQGIDSVIRLQQRDVLLGVLPMFHSFGYTVTLWTVLTLDPMGVYHYTPLEPRSIGALCRKYGCTILIATPTFLRAYLRRCDAEDLRSLDVVFAGAEKLPPELATAFHQRFGVLPVEGYGTTELSPVVSGNRPPSRDSTIGQRGNHIGTIGQPITGVEVKVIDIDTGADLPCGRQGMLLVRGPNVMKGYLNRPDLTAEVMRGDWYMTGDLAKIDEEDYITITGRISRFSKIGGEMVPHLRVEAAVREVLADDHDAQLAVTAVHDAARGERLVVLHSGLGMPAAEICRQMLFRGIPPLWVPSPDSFRQVAAIPQLGTGKLDLGRLKEMAETEFADGNEP